MIERKRWTPGTKFAMRQFIFEFEQLHAITLGLELADLLLLDYFLKFFQEDRAKMILLDRKRYFLIRYSKILEDLPILRMSDKTMRRKMAELEQKQILSRHVKGNRDLYVCVNWDKVFDREKDDSQNCPAIVNIDGQTDQRNSGALDSSVLPPGQERAAIENYNNKKIKIITDTRACELDKSLLIREIHKQIKFDMSSVAFDLWFKDCKITDIADTFVELAFSSEYAAENAKKEYYLKKLETAVQTAVQLFQKD